MVKKIDTFYVVDFDRCIGNIEGSFHVLKEVAHELSIVDRHVFKSMREKIELSGAPFSALEYLRENHPSTKLDVIDKIYLSRAKKETDILLESGASDFLDFLRSTEREFCIMSFGEKRWQSIKIIGAGITNTPTVIVPKAQKSDYILKWQDPKDGKFVIPKEFFLDCKPKEADEIVLIDDKTVAFENMPVGVRGYLVLGSSTNNTKLHLNDDIPLSVKKITHVDEIIDMEIKHVQTVNSNVASVKPSGYPQNCE